MYNRELMMPALLVLTKIDRIGEFYAGPYRMGSPIFEVLLELTVRKRRHCMLCHGSRGSHLPRALCHLTKMGIS
jgi:hypothetical protein